MKKIISWNNALRILFLFYFLFVATTSYALPFTIIPKAGTTLPSTLPPGTTPLAFYTVINNTVSFRANNFVKYLPLNVVQIGVGGVFPDTCAPFFSLPPGGSCTLELAVLGPVNANDPDPHHHLFVCFPGGITCAGTSFPLNVIPPSPALTIPLAVAVGQISTAPNPPLLVKTLNGGVSWIVDPTVFATTGLFTAASCFGNNAAGACIAVGQDTPLSGPALLAKSLDAGVTWTVQAPALPNGILRSASCFGTGPSGVCIAVGQLATGAPLLVTSTDGGVMFGTVTVPGVTNGDFLAASCFGSTCVAAGNNNDVGGLPLLFVSLNRGLNFNLTIVAGLPINTDFLGASCSGIGTTSSFCIAVGRSGSQPTIAQSTDGGLTWSQFSMTFAAAGQFNSGSCTGSPAVCIAVGLSGGPGPPLVPLLAQTINGGTNWTLPTITGLPLNGTFSSASCAGSGTTAVCIAGGQSLDDNSPLLVVSLNGGVSWARQTLIGGPATGVFNSVSCSGSGPGQLCIAAGRNLDTGAPLLVQSTDGGVTWSIPIIVGLPASGIFFGSSTSNSTTTILEEQLRIRSLSLPVNIPS